ncbi:MAG: inorganic phosphate transporter [Ichthyobacteriaceae bacterium]|nr:inorganic phosphate transporter [Ichthyobacteriaceae bacterium]
MDNVYLAIIILMIGLAVFDLIVGVSNDAVNFLTSSVGSKAAPFRVVMIVASIGIIFGAASSGGMMEVAKSGVFFPDKLTFQDLLFIYVVVMVSDIILLDLFNSLKLPTSTSISIVFELLGASFAFSMLKIYDNNIALAEIGNYINSNKAVQMIVAIFFSVIAAFILGWLIQFIMRSILTFEYEKYNKIGGSIFGGVSVAIVANFIYRVGLKSASYVSPEIKNYVDSNTVILFIVVAVLAFIMFYVLVSRKKIDPFRIVTLMGTFALAMAFASNDLINFIGVSVAGLEGYGLWQASGLPADEMTMEAFLGEGEATSAWILLSAGIIMAATLFLSKKAKNVIQTSVDLSRQKDGVERFSGNIFVRWVVSFFIKLSDLFTAILPESFVKLIDLRFSRRNIVNVDPQSEPAFDMVRASVNLIVAALLISTGTIYKLPLSTTYVSFMVLMGTSLADKAWNRDTAVYRVSGVATVVAGWFITGLSAFTISSLLAILVYKYEFIGIGIALLIVILSVYLISKLTNNDLKLDLSLEFPDNWFDLSSEEVKPFMREQTIKLLNAYRKSFDLVIESLETENRANISEMTKKVKHLKTINIEYSSRLSEQLKLMDTEHINTGKLFLKFYTLEDDLLNEFEELAKITRTHILNLHRPLKEKQLLEIRRFQGNINLILDNIETSLVSSNSTISDSDNLLEKIMDKSFSAQIEGLTADKYNYKNSRMYFHVFTNNIESVTLIRQMCLLVK